jgi:hypothetical protein
MSVSFVQDLLLNRMAGALAGDRRPAKTLAGNIRIVIVLYIVITSQKVINNTSGNGGGRGRGSICMKRADEALRAVQQRARLHDAWKKHVLMLCFGAESGQGIAAVQGLLMHKVCGQLAAASVTAVTVTGDQPAGWTASR